MLVVQCRLDAIRKAPKAKRGFDAQEERLGSVFIRPPHDPVLAIGAFRGNAPVVHSVLLGRFRSHSHDRIGARGNTGSSREQPTAWQTYRHEPLATTWRIYSSGQGGQRRQTVHRFVRLRCAPEIWTRDTVGIQLREACAIPHRPRRSRIHVKLKRIWVGRAIRRQLSLTGVSV